MVVFVSPHWLRFLTSSSLDQRVYVMEVIVGTGGGLLAFREVLVRDRVDAPATGTYNLHGPAVLNLLLMFSS